MITAHDRAAPSEEVADLLETAWGIIANAGWDGLGKSPGWQEAAVKWRDRYHGVLASYGVARHEGGDDAPEETQDEG